MAKGIVIDEFKCDGCGLCVAACHEGALAMIDGKARMVRADFCDGLGDCLPVCPQGAISFIELCGCEVPQIILPGTPSPLPAGNIPTGPGSGELRQWPVKIRLVSASSPIFRNADVLLAADCSAFTYSKMHEDLIKGRAVAICCPKFDTGHTEKLAEIFSNNDIRSLTVVRMTVPCCSLDGVAREAAGRSGKNIPVKVLTIDQKGYVRESAR
jgi:NAD-dependent dihydropyrimidine dehydrogenase PreA subunit